ncbi:MAG: hypothetical protein WB762_06870 [Candidatus Sulfotelmatobacter sp.]
MNVHLAQELLNELGSSLESLEAQQSALLQFLKEKGVVTDDQLAPYLNQASNASNVRWRAARVRLERLFSVETEKEQTAAQEQKQAAAQPPPQSMEGAKDKGKDDKDKSESKSDSKPAAREGASAKKEKASAETKSAVPASKEATNGEEKKPSTTKRDEEAA